MQTKQTKPTKKRRQRKCKCCHRMFTPQAQTGLKGTYLHIGYWILLFPRRPAPDMMPAVRRILGSGNACPAGLEEHGLQLRLEKRGGRAA